MATSDRIRRLPKAELHIHIEGTLEPELAFELADRNGVSLPYGSIDALRAQYEFEDLQSFLDLYYACMTVLHTRADFEDLGEAYLERAHRDGVSHVELFFDPQVHVGNGVALDDVIDGLKAALHAAGERYGITGGLIMCFLRDQPVQSAEEILNAVSTRAHDLLGVGLDSAEVGNPPSLFADVFEAARRLGLHVVAHAGEEGPADYISEALDLEVDRIDHGIRAVEDVQVLDRLRETGVPLTVCPLSNVRLRAVEDLASHPLPALLNSGVAVTINSDDPAYFGGYVADNYDAVATQFDLDDSVLATLARNSIRASFASEDRKRGLLDCIDQWEREKADEVRPG